MDLMGGHNLGNVVNVEGVVEHGNDGAELGPLKRLYKRKFPTPEEKVKEILMMKKILVALYENDCLWNRNRLRPYKDHDWTPIARDCNLSSGKEAYEYFKKIKNKIMYHLDQFQKSRFGGLGSKMEWITQYKRKELTYLSQMQCTFPLWPYCEYLTKLMVQKKFDVKILQQARGTAFMRRCRYEFGVGLSSAQRLPILGSTPPNTRKHPLPNIASRQLPPGTQVSCQDNAQSRNVDQRMQHDPSSAYAQAQTSSGWNPTPEPSSGTIQQFRMDMGFDLSTIKLEPDADGQSHGGVTSTAAAAAPMLDGLSEGNSQMPLEANQAQARGLSLEPDMFEYMRHVTLSVNEIKAEVDDEGYAVETGAVRGPSENGSVTEGTLGQNQTPREQFVFVRVPIYKLPKSKDLGVPFEEYRAVCLDSSHGPNGAEKVQKLKGFFTPLPQAFQRGTYDSLLNKCSQLLDSVSKFAMISKTAGTTHEVLEQRAAEMFST